MQYVTLEDTVYFWFAANDTSGSGSDGASAVYDVREGGVSPSASPTASGSATLLTHANYPAGCYEVAVAATASNGFSANKSYGVFCSLAVDSQNPSGKIGEFRTAPSPANATQWGGTAVTGMPMPTYSQPSGFLAATFPSDPADQSLVVAATDSLAAAIGALHNLSLAQAQAAAAAALATYDPPTNAELEARTLPAASYATAAAVAAVDALVDQLVTDAQPEPTGVPSPTATPAVKLAWVFKALVRGLSVTATEKTFRNAAGSAEWKKTLSDDGTTYVEGAATAP